MQKLARLTVAWRLVDPVTKEPLDVPYSPETAAEFYALPKAYPFFLQAGSARMNRQILSKPRRRADGLCRACVPARPSLADGATEGEHRASAERQWEALGRTRAASSVVSEAPPFPAELAYLWTWFNELSAGLAITGMGPSVLTWEGLDAWRRLMRACSIRGSDMPDQSQPVARADPERKAGGGGKKTWR